MLTAKVNGLDLEYEAQGSGEPVLLIHGAMVAETFVPLMKEPALAKYRLIRYHRRGFAGSEHPGTITNFHQQAADAAALLRHLGVAPAHVVGHSYGGLTALRVALDHPALTHTLSLIEPPLLASPFGQAFIGGAMAPVVAAYRGGDKRRARDLFVAAVSGPDEQKILDRMLPGAGEQALRDLDTFFASELPDVRTGLFTEAEAAGIGIPTLSIVGEKTEPVFRESHAALMKCLPQVEALAVAGATHFVQVDAPRVVAQAIAAFLARHPL